MDQMLPVSWTLRPGRPRCGPYVSQLRCKGKGAVDEVTRGEQLQVGKRVEERRREIQSKISMGSRVDISKIFIGEKILDSYLDEVRGPFTCQLSYFLLL